MHALHGIASAIVLALKLAWIVPMLIAGAILSGGFRLLVHPLCWFTFVVLFVAVATLARRMR
jgi:hypothetical protein